MVVRSWAAVRGEKTNDDSKLSGGGRNRAILMHRCEPFGFGRCAMRIWLEMDEMVVPEDAIFLETMWKNVGRTEQ